MTALQEDPGAMLRQLTLARRVRSAPDRYRYDPADPTPAVGGVRIGVGRMSGRRDNTALEARADVLTYNSQLTFLGDAPEVLLHPDDAVAAGGVADGEPVIVRSAAHDPLGQRAGHRQAG